MINKCLTCGRNLSGATPRQCVACMVGVNADQPRPITLPANTTGEPNLRPYLDMQPGTQVDSPYGVLRLTDITVSGPAGPFDDAELTVTLELKIAGRDMQIGPREQPVPGGTWKPLSVRENEKNFSDKQILEPVE